MSTSNKAPKLAKLVAQTRKKGINSLYDLAILSAIGSDPDGGKFYIEVEEVVGYHAYSSLKRLAQRGFLKHKSMVGQGAPGSRYRNMHAYYKITAKGRNTLAKWQVGGE